MPKYNITITTNCEDSQKAGELSSLLKGTFDKVQQEDIVKLLKAVNAKPGLVKTALNFL
jgi:hypothetical protein